MKTIAKALVLALAFRFGLHHAGAQDAPKKVAPKPPNSASQTLLESWSDLVEDFPEDKYDFKPNPTERSFAEQLLHAAGANYFSLTPLRPRSHRRGIRNVRTIRPRPMLSRL